MQLGWLKIRLPDTKQVLWLFVAHDPERDRDLALITNVPIHTAEDAETVYTQWCYRPQIEHTYRFDQEDGLDVEDVRVQTLERMRRIFALVLMQPCSFTISLMSGLSAWCCGCAAWEANWDFLQTATGSMCCSRVSELSSSPPPAGIRRRTCLP
jgi:hypothetical protein